MSRIKDDRLLDALGPWPSGANNLARETAVPRTQLREAVNVDLFSDGRVRRRKGRRKVLDIADPHSMFSIGRACLFAAGPTLYELTSDFTANPIGTVTPNAPLYYEFIEPYVFISDGTNTYRYSPGAALRSWSIPAPGAPQLSASEGGSLPAATYYVATAYRLNSGEEGSASPQARIALVSEAGIRVDLPAPPAGVDRVSVYMTKPNGEQLMLAATVPAVATSITLASPQLGRMADTLDTAPMPAVAHPCYHNGRLLGFVDELLVWSEPNRYGITRLDYNFTAFSEPGTMIASPGEGSPGVFIGQASRTYFLRGASPADASLREVYPYGVVPRSKIMVPGSKLPMDNPPTEPVPVWMATNGAFVVGMPDGSVLPLSEKRYAANVGPEAATLYRESEGLAQCVAAVRDPSQNAFAVGDSASAEVVRNGIVL